MSLDVYLSIPSHAGVAGGIFVREDGQTKEISAAEWYERNPGVPPVVVEQYETECVYSANITHNLNVMADKAGIYNHLWRPEELGITKAAELIEPLKEGYLLLCHYPDQFVKFNPANGWGTYEGLVNFVLNYLRACVQYPQADVSVWR